MPELTASVVDTVIVLSVDILGPEYHTYAVTFPAGQTIEAGREMVSHQNIFTHLTLNFYLDSRHQFKEEWRSQWGTGRTNCLE